MKPTKKKKKLANPLAPAIMQEMKEKIERAGRLQVAQKATTDAYNEARDEVYEMILNNVGINTEVIGNKFSAELVKEDRRYIDPNNFITKVKNKNLRTICLNVSLGATETTLKKLNPQLLADLIELRAMANPTLYIRHVVVAEPTPDIKPDKRTRKIRL